MRALPLFIPLLAFAQTPCPPVNFLTARDASLKPSPTTHIDAVRQRDGSWTAFEVTDAVPYRTIAVTPRFEAQLTACLPARPASLNHLAIPASNPPGAGSQLQVSLQLSSGNFLLASVGVKGLSPLFFDLFDSQHNLLSENTFSYSAPNGNTPFIRTDSFIQILLADLNNDGNQDLVAVFTTNRLLEGGTQGGVWTFIGNGDGTFQNGKRQVVNIASQLGEEPAGAAAIADLNGDGKPDLVLPWPSRDAITVAAGNGDGTFSTTPQTVLVQQTTSPNLRSVVIADLDGDGKPDLIVTSRTLPDLAPAIAVALNNGDGSFQTPALFPALVPNGRGAIIAIGDLNNDNIPDIATSGGTVLFGDGKGNFPLRRDYPPADSDTASVMLFDFDGDGHTDIVFGNGSPSLLSGNTTEPNLTVLLGSTNGFFDGAPAITRSTNNGVPPVVADFDNDGIPDAAFLAYSASNGLQITTVQGQGNGQFAPLATQSVPLNRAFVPTVFTTDFNRDGNQDIATFTSDSSGQFELFIFIGRGNGTFNNPVVVTLGAGLPIAIADFNNDGIPDIVSGGSESVDAPDPVTVWLGKGDLTFSPQRTSLHLANNAAAAVADFNGDGKPDIAVINFGVATLNILLGKGDGTLAAPLATTLPDVGVASSFSIAAADFNLDGHADLAIDLGKPSGSSQVAILLGKGDGAFSAPISQPALLPFRVADINGDKIPDLIGSASVRLGNGDGTFQPDYAIRVGGGINAVADVNRDNVPDLLSFSPGNPGGSLISYINLSRPALPLTIVSAATFTAGPLAPGSIAAAFGENLSSPGLTIGVLDSANTNHPASVLFSSRNQINFRIPPESALGPATITLYNSPGFFPLNTAVILTRTAPALFTLGAGVAAAYAVQVAPDNTQTTTLATSPIDVTQPGQTFLVLFGTGFDSATSDTTSASIQGLPAIVTYAGPQPTFAGLDQINLLLPRSLAGAGLVSVVANVGGQPSNIVHVTVQ